MNTPTLPPSWTPVPPPHAHAPISCYTQIQDLAIARAKAFTDLEIAAAWKQCQAAHESGSPFAPDAQTWSVSWDPVKQFAQDFAEGIGAVPSGMVTMVRDGEEVVVSESLDCDGGCVY